MNRQDINNAIFNRTTQPYTLLSSRKTGLKEEEKLKFWTVHYVSKSKPIIKFAGYFVKNIQK